MLSTCRVGSHTSVSLALRYTKVSSPRRDYSSSNCAFILTYLKMIFIRWKPLQTLQYEFAMHNKNDAQHQSCCLTTLNVRSSSVWSLKVGGARSVWASQYRFKCQQLCVREEECLGITQDIHRWCYSPPLSVENRNRNNSDFKVSPQNVSWVLGAGRKCGADRDSLHDIVFLFLSPYYVG